MSIDLDQTVAAYLECALWAECCRGTATHDGCRGEDCDTALEDIDAEVSADAVRQATEDVSGFLSVATEDRPDVFDGMDPAQIGHDFYLTRNGYGAGFWDRGLGEVGDYLTHWSKTFGSADFYVGSDELIHCS